MKFNRNDLEEGLKRKIFRWVDTIMKEELPAWVYENMHGNFSDRSKSSKWLAERGYRVVTHPDGVAQIFRGTKLLKQTKMVLELTNPEELLQIMEVVHENVNIPPPPWQPKSA